MVASNDDQELPGDFFFELKKTLACSQREALEANLGRQLVTLSEQIYIRRIAKQQNPSRDDEADIMKSSLHSAVSFYASLAENEAFLDEAAKLLVDRIEENHKKDKG